MENKVLAPIPRWANAVHVLMLVVSLMVIALPDTRNLVVRLLLALLLFMSLFHSVLRLKRANGLRTPMSQLSSHLPSTQSFADSLAFVATLSGCFAQVFVF